MGCQQGFARLSTRYGNKLGCQLRASVWGSQPTVGASAREEEEEEESAGDAKAGQVG